MTITSKNEWGSIVRGFRNPLHVRRRAGTVEPFKFAESHGLGVFEHTEYRTGSCSVVPGDLIMLFTDGLFEVKIAKGDFYGEERLSAAVRQRIGIPTEELSTQVVDEIQQACVEKEFNDDVCLLGVEVVRTRCSRARARGGMKAGAASSDNW